MRDVRRTISSFRYALDGIGYLIWSQPNFRVHLCAAGGALVLALWLELPWRDLSIIALAIGLVLAAEAMNSAIEVAVDLAQPDRHPLARVAKDAAAGGVLIACLAALVVGLLLLLPALAARFGG